MKKSFLFGLIFFFSPDMGYSQVDSFDVFTYQKPEFFTKNELPSSVQYSMTNKDGSFCTITLYKSLASKEDTLQTIMNQWNAFVLKRLTKADKKPVQTLTGQALEGWASSLAMGNFYRNSKKAIVMLLSFKSEKLSACVVFTCSDKSFKGPIEAFSENIHLKQQQ
jgi:hypothetical protein